MTKVTRSSGIVFRDLGFAPGETERLQMRATLMAVASQLIVDRRLTQARAAALFGVTQPRVSDLVRGRTELFSIDGLIEMLGRAGVRIEMRVANTRARKKVRVA
jgi:predicted XRE-type DNA-binding protein